MTGKGGNDAPSDAANYRRVAPCKWTARPCGETEAHHRIAEVRARG